MIEIDESKNKHFFIGRCPECAILWEAKDDELKRIRDFKEEERNGHSEYQRVFAKCENCDTMIKFHAKEYKTCLND